MLDTFQLRKRLHGARNLLVYVLLECYLPLSVLHVLLIGLQSTTFDIFLILSVDIYSHIPPLLSQNSDKIFLYNPKYLFLLIVKQW